MSDGEGKQEERRNAARLLLSRVCCIVGLLSAAGGIAFALLGASDNVSAGAVGAALGIVGYFLGDRRLGAVTIALGVIAVFIMAAASTGLIPGVAPVGHGYD
jgi:VIT1/CCC1 family predicted Fe2+/Mn2+ transporter